MSKNIQTLFLFKSLIKFRTNIKSKRFYFFCIEDIAILLLGIIFTVGIGLNNELNFIEKTKIFSSISIGILSLFVLQKNNYLFTTEQKNNFLQLFPISRSKIRLIDSLVFYIDSLKSFIIFLVPFLIYILIVSTPINIIGVIFAILYIPIFSLVTCETMKNIILLLSRHFNLIYKIKQAIFTCLFSIFYFLLIKNSSFLLGIKWSPFLAASEGFSIANNGFDYKAFLVYLLYTFLSFIIYFGIFPLIYLKDKRKKKNFSFSVFNYKKTYQKSAISAIADTMITRDENTNSVLLDSIITNIFSFIWMIVIFHSSTIFTSFNHIIYVASATLLFKSGKDLEIALVSTQQHCLKQFENLNDYSDRKIFNEILKKIILRNFYIYFIPIICINLYFFSLHLSYQIVSLSVLFLASHFIYYKFLLRYKPFSFLKNDRKKPYNLLHLILSFVLLIFHFVGLRFVKNQLYIFGSCIIVFLFPALIMIYLILTFRFTYYPNPIMQNLKNSCGRTCVKMLGLFYGKEIDIDKITNYGDNFYSMINLANNYNLNLKAYETSDLSFLKTPFIAQVIKQKTSHFVVVYSIQKNYLIVLDPLCKNTYDIKIAKFNKMFTGNVLTKES